MFSQRIKRAIKYAKLFMENNIIVLLIVLILQLYVTFALYERLIKGETLAVPCRISSKNVTLHIVILENVAQQLQSDASIFLTASFSYGNQVSFYDREEIKFSEVIDILLPLDSLEDNMGNINDTEKGKLVYIHNIISDKDDNMVFFTNSSLLTGVRKNCFTKSGHLYYGVPGYVDPTHVFFVSFIIVIEIIILYNCIKLK